MTTEEQKYARYMDELQLTALLRAAALTMTQTLRKSRQSASRGDTNAELFSMRLTVGGCSVVMRADLSSDVSPTIWPDTTGEPTHR